MLMGWIYINYKPWFVELAVFWKQIPRDSCAVYTFICIFLIPGRRTLKEKSEIWIRRVYPLRSGSLPALRGGTRRCRAIQIFPFIRFVVTSLSLLSPCRQVRRRFQTGTNFSLDFSVIISTFCRSAGRRISLYNTAKKKGLSWQAFWDSCWNFLNISRFAAALFSLNLFARNNFARQENGKLSSPPLVPGTALIQQSRSFFFSLWENLKRKRIAAQECWRQNLFGEKLRKDDSVRVSPGAYISKACGGRVSVVAL